MTDSAAAAAAPATEPAKDAAPTAAPAAQSQTPAADAKPAADAGKKDTPAADAKTAPGDFEKQWAEFKAPEGFDKDQLKGIIEFARANGVPPKAAAALAVREQARQKAEAEHFKHMSEKGWLEELQKDPDLGGPKVRETMVDVMRAADKLPPKVQALIKEQGVLYNPIVVRILHAFGQGLKEDQFVRPGASPAQEKKQSLDERLQGLWK